MHKSYLIWLIAAFLALGGFVTAIVLSISEGDGVALSLTLGFTIIAAVAAAGGAFITWAGNRASQRQQQQMAEDIRRLTELTQGSIEEARAQRPKPVVRFELDGEGVEGLRLTRSNLDRELDTEAILALERQRALDSLPRDLKSEKMETGRPASSIAGPDVARQIRELHEKLSSSSAWLRGIGLQQQGPATAEEKAEFDKRVTAYLEKVRKWLDEYQEWRKERQVLVRFRLRFENHGHVPCYGGRYEIHFPDPFEEGPEDEPTLSGPPKRPKFARPKPRGLGFSGLSIPDLYPSRLSPLAPISSINRNVSRPRFHKGSVIVDIDVKKLLHGVHEESDVIALRCPDDGAYTVSWLIHAENLAQPASGELMFEVVTNVEEGSPISDLEDLVALLWPDTPSETDG